MFIIMLYTIILLYIVYSGRILNSNSIELYVNYCSYPLNHSLCYYIKENTMKKLKSTTGHGQGSTSTHANSELVELKVTVVPVLVLVVLEVLVVCMVVLVVLIVIYVICM